MTLIGSTSTEISLTPTSANQIMLLSIFNILRMVNGETKAFMVVEHKDVFCLYA